MLARRQEKRYSGFVVNAYEEVIDFIASGPSARAVASFRASGEANQRVEWLVEQSRNGQLSAEDKRELEHFLALEHLMRLAKARARLRLLNEPAH